MKLKPIDVIENISPQEFKTKYYSQAKPVLIKKLSHAWPAYEKWNWDFIKSKVGHVKVGVYDNVKSNAYTPINKSDGEMLFGDYIDLVRKGPVGLRIFLFNIFEHAPEMINDFTYPDHLMNGFLRKYPMLFTGGAGSITHMHYDIDLSHILHTQFNGRKRILLIDPLQSAMLYQMPFTVLSLINFEKYYEGLDEDKYPALKYLEGYDFVMEHGDTLFMPGGYWHHMEYIDSGFAMSLRAMDNSVLKKMRGVYNLFGMRNIDTMVKKNIHEVWARFK